MQEFYLDSHGKGRVHCCFWPAQGELRAIVQIVHGIAEYAERYDAFAAFLNERGIAVAAEDHMGHGKTAGTQMPKGYFYGGWSAAVADSYGLLAKLRQEHPRVPYFLFGHSMGSFMARTMLYTYPDSGIAGAILCGTGWQPRAVLEAGLLLAEAECLGGREDKPSPGLEKLMFGSYNKGIDPQRTPYDWLNRDSGAVDRYIADPMCGFPATPGLARDMLTGIRMNQDPKNLAKMRKELPVLFVAGQADPVGAWGKGVSQTVGAFGKAGMQHITQIMYPGGRHEILNETNKTQVYEDIYHWICENL